MNVPARLNMVVCFISSSFVKTLGAKEITEVSLGSPFLFNKNDDFYQVFNSIFPCTHKEKLFSCLSMFITTFSIFTIQS